MSHADPETASLCSEGPSPSAGAAQPIFLPSEVAANRFRVVRLLGHGGMAQVFQAEDLELGQEVAIKVIRPELAPRRRAQELLRREVLLARRVTHPNVCRTFDVFHHQPGPGIGTGPASADAGETAPPGMLLLVMELLRGETLARRLAAGGPLTPAEALPIVCQLADALDAAHRSQVVHGDFKSSNVILEPTCRGPRAVVTDFGLAQHASMTAACAGGTTAYMAPEQLERREVTPSSDIYALGIVIFEMVSGRRPLVGEMSGASTSLHFPRLASLPPRRPRLPPGWEAAIGRCLAPAIGDRPANAGEVAAALVASIAREPGAADGPVLPQPIQRRRERGRARILARSALVLGCLGLAAIDRARVDRAEAGPTSPARSGSAGVPGVPGGPGWPGSEAAEGAAAAARDLGAGGGGDEGSAAGDPGAVARQVLAVAPLVDRSARPAEPWLGAALSHRIASEIGGAGGGSGAEVLRAPVATLFADRRLPSGTQLVVGGSFAVAEEAAGRRLRIDLALAPAVKGAPLPSFHEAGQLTEAADLASRLAVRLRRA
ncbi:MAG TPA: serine/threonine-protein kinase, partial [Thermoanaerobaculia bacterium]|nr:serine/threonine-protein kinase [Thermoanaerobaculia bacterium]